MTQEVDQLVEENKKLQLKLNWMARWVERGIYQKNYSAPIDALRVIAHSPDMPWHSQEWDVSHKEYAEEFYKDFPKARPKSDDTDIRDGII